MKAAGGNRYSHTHGRLHLPRVKSGLPSVHPLTGIELRAERPLAAGARAGPLRVLCTSRRRCNIARAFRTSSSSSCKFPWRATYPFHIRTNFFHAVTYVTGICGHSRVKSQWAKKKPRQGRARSRGNKWGACRTSPRVETCSRACPHLDLGSELSGGSSKDTPATLSGAFRKS